jgi:hypothetical protein
MSSIPNNTHNLRIVAVKSTQRAEYQLLYSAHMKEDLLFEMYYLLVNCTDGGVVRDRKHSGLQIRAKLGLTRAQYDMMMHRLKLAGLVRLEGKYLCIKGTEDIDWNNRPDGLLVTQNLSK